MWTRNCLISVCFLLVTLNPCQQGRFQFSSSNYVSWTLKTKFIRRFKIYKIKYASYNNYFSHNSKSSEVKSGSVLLCRGYTSGEGGEAGILSLDLDPVFYESGFRRPKKGSETFFFWFCHVQNCPHKKMVNLGQFSTHHWKNYKNYKSGYTIF